MLYKKHLIERARVSGYYYARSEKFGGYLQSDTLKGIKYLINLYL